MTRWLRRHARWFTAALILVLAGGLAFALRSAGSANAQPARRVAQVRAIAPPVLAPAARGRTGRVGTQLVSSHSGSRGPLATAASTRIRPGVPSPAPSSQAESLALRKVTGLTSAQVSARSVCPRAAAGHASCAAQLLVLRSTGAPVRPHVVRFSSLGRVRRAVARGAQPAAVVASAAPPSADTPAYLQQAYDLSALAQTGGTGDTIGVVDAYDDPTAASDLSVYRAQYGLPACTTSNGCFRKVGQTGTSSLPGPDSSWEQEISLDLDAVSAICPNCHILLVEANSDKFSDLQAAMQTAANLGVKQISASWDGISSGVPAAFQTFSGIATVAATGDSGYVGAGQDAYPAALPGVTAAGGTSLAPATTPSARGFGESAWAWNGQNGGASGCDLLFARPVYQPAEGCTGRAYADLSADADPHTGLTVYNHGTWSLLGGTSLSTPLIAAYYAITGVADATPQWAYSDSAALNDIVSGSNGTCAASISYICNAGPGYDGPTGVGSISGSVVVGAPGIGGPSVASGTSNTYTSAVTTHGATISAGIYRNGLDTNWSIQYGTTTSYGSQTPAIDLGAGSAPVAATAYLSQLTPGTTYHYRVVAENSLGTTYGYDYTLTTEPAPAGAPVAAFAYSPSAASPNSPVSFDATASTPGTGGSISDYSWNFGDGTGTVDAGAQAITTHTYTARGTYTVTLTVTSNGQTDTSTQTVTVDTAPTASFTTSASAVPSGGGVSFNAGGSTASPGGQLTDYSWNFGDGTASQDTGTTPTTSHTFTTPGTYTVTLTTTDDLDVIGTTTEQITVAAFTVSQPLPAPGQQVTFTSVGSYPGGSTYSWNFGDGTAPTPGATAPHTYLSRGSYTVTLTVQSGSDTTQTTGTVDVDSPPTPAFTPSASAVLPGTSVGFDGSASSASGSGTIADYSWNFGDGTASQDTGTTPTTTHTFNTPGIYAVTLTTTDELGASAPVSHQVTVDDPSAAFTDSQSMGTTESFNAAGTTDPESTITDYSWNFGDGSSTDAGSAPTTSHTFAVPGTYTVTLTATDQLGLTSTSTQQVAVAPVSAQSSGTSTPPSTTSTPTPPVSPPVSTPPSTSGGNGSSHANPVVAKVTGSGRQRLSTVTLHGLRFSLAVNQRAGASIQITIPLSQTTQAGSHRTRQGANATVVLVRASRSLTVGSHSLVVKLSRGALGQLAASGPLTLTVKVTFTGAGGHAVTRTLKITLTRGTTRS